MIRGLFEGGDDFLNEGAKSLGELLGKKTYGKLK